MPQPAEIPVAFNLTIANCTLRSPAVQHGGSSGAVGAAVALAAAVSPCAKLLNFIESASMNEVGLVIFIRSVSAASVGRHRQGGELIDASSLGREVWA